MRRFGTDAALIAVPALIAAAAAALAGHYVLASMAETDGQWFSRSMWFLPVYFGAAAFATYALAELVEGRLAYPAISIGKAREAVIGFGALAAFIGLAYQPSVFVAIGASAAGGAWLLNARKEAARRVVRSDIQPRRIEPA